MNTTSEFVFDTRDNKRNNNSPLFTSKSDSAKKRAFLKEKGKDLDGAYRVHNRLDSQKKN